MDAISDKYSDPAIHSVLGEPTGLEFECLDQVGISSIFGSAFPLSVGFLKSSAMRLRKLVPTLSVATLFVAAIVAVPTPTPAAASATTIKLGDTVPMLDSGQPISYVGVPVSITCPAGSGPTQFNFFVTQSPNVTGSFGTVTAECSGLPEKFVVAVQSNFGSLYHEGQAVASANCFFPCAATAQRNVTMFRLADDF